MKEEMPSCENCSYRYFDHNDMHEYEKCKIVGKYNEFPVNKKVKELIEKYDLKEVCEYWQRK